MKTSTFSKAQQKFGHSSSAEIYDQENLPNFNGERTEKRDGATWDIQEEAEIVNLSLNHQTAYFKLSERKNFNFRQRKHWKGN